MIPKIIHYCWFGGKPKPEEVINNINNWKKILPEYEIIEWNESNFDINKLLYTKQAYEDRKFAFVSDICRLDCLIKYGGIYLDTDVEVIKTFNNFLCNKSFIGLEEDNKVSTAMIAAEAKCQWLIDFRTEYDNIPFREHFRKITIANTTRLSRFLKNYSGDKPKIYPIDYFSVKNFMTGEVKCTDNTICIHHFNASWVPKYKIQKIENKIWMFLGMKNYDVIGKIIKFIKK